MYAKHAMLTLHTVRILSCSSGESTRGGIPAFLRSNMGTAVEEASQQAAHKRRPHAAQEPTSVSIVRALYVIRNRAAR